VFRDTKIFFTSPATLNKEVGRGREEEIMEQKKMVWKGK